MKPFSALIIAATSACFFSIKLPAQEVPKNAANAEQKKPTPEEAIRNFVAAINNENPYFGAIGAIANPSDVGYFGGPQLGQRWLERRGDNTIEIEKIETKAIDINTVQIMVSYHLKTSKYRSDSQTEQLEAALTPPNFLQFGTSWRLKAPLPSPNEPINDLRLSRPIFQQLLKRFASPQIYVKQLDAEESMSRLHLLAIGVLQFVQDYDERYAFAPEYAVDALSPYVIGINPEAKLKAEKLTPFLAPTTKRPYTFNGRLSGRNASDAAFSNKSNVVMFYEGSKEKPIFRYDGKAAIAFADGYVRFMTPKQMKNVRWAP